MPINIDALTSRPQTDIYKLLGTMLQWNYPELVSKTGIPVNISSVKTPEYGGLFKKSIELPESRLKEPINKDMLLSVLDSVLHEYKHGQDAALGSPGKAILQSMTYARRQQLEDYLTSSNLPSTNTVRGAKQVDEALATKYSNDLLKRIVGMSYYGADQDRATLQDTIKLFPEFGATK